VSLVEETFESVLEAAKTGEEWAWAALYHEYAGPVTGYLSSRGASDPEGLTGDVLLKVARSIHSFSGDLSSFRSWVFVIAHRRLIDERRTLSRRPGVSELVADPPGGDVESEAMEGLVAAELWRAFKRLTDGQRDVLALRIIGGLTLEETARVMGKKVGAVKAVQRRALQAIHDNLDLDGVTI
jgi:RNA polymerase sigma-70 factor (ECF subfamily)